MPIRSGSAIALGLLLAAFSAQAADVGDLEWLRRSRGILEGAGSEPRPAWLRMAPSEDALDEAQGIAQAAGMRGAPEPRPLAAPGTVLVFGSFALPEPTLRNLLEQARAPDVVFVLRGLPAGASIPEAVRRLRRLAGDTEDPPNVILDPTLFRRLNVSVAPTLVLLRGNDAPVTVAGAVTVEWLRRRAARLGDDASPDLGTRGETYAIAEVDLIHELQRRLAAIDWAKRKEEALDRFWARKVDYVDLPLAREDREFVVDPTVRVARDITGRDGRVLVRAGETFNPLDWVPLTKTVIVLDGTDARQIRTVAPIAARVRSEGRGVVLVTTTLEASGGWKSLARMETDLEGPVFLLERTLAERFHLERVPSVVSTRGRRLVVREVAVEE